MLWELNLARKRSSVFSDHSFKSDWLTPLNSDHAVQVLLEVSLLQGGFCAVLFSFKVVSECSGKPISTTVHLTTYTSFPSFLFFVFGLPTPPPHLLIASFRLSEHTCWQPCFAILCADVCGVFAWQLLRKNAVERLGGGADDSAPIKVTFLPLTFPPVVCTILFLGMCVSVCVCYGFLLSR